MYVNHFLIQTQSALFFIHILPSCRCHLFTCTTVEPNIIREIEQKNCIIEIQLHKIEVKTPRTERILDYVIIKFLINKPFSKSDKSYFSHFCLSCSKGKKPENDMIRQVSIVSNFINENHFKKCHKTSETS